MCFFSRAMPETLLFGAKIDVRYHLKRSLRAKFPSRQDKTLERDMGRESEARDAELCFQVKDGRALSNNGM
jgi:hypothetical protein